MLPARNGRNSPPIAEPTRSVRHRPRPALARPMPMTVASSASHGRYAVVPSIAGIQPASSSDQAKAIGRITTAMRVAQPSAGLKRRRSSSLSTGRGRDAAEAVMASPDQELAERTSRDDGMHGHIELREGMAQGALVLLPLGDLVGILGLGGPGAASQIEDPNEDATRADGARHPHAGHPPR